MHLSVVILVEWPVQNLLFGCCVTKRNSPTTNQQHSVNVIRKHTSSPQRQWPRHQANVPRLPSPAKLVHGAVQEGWLPCCIKLQHSCKLPAISVLLCGFDQQAAGTPSQRSTWGHLAAQIIHQESDRPRN
jgi:hypothetical protein